MADSNPKRAKMDNPNGQSSSTNPKDRKIQPDLMNTSTQSFEKIRNMPGFVDHTHFIRSFLLKKANLAIFAPRRFGKSSHLDMVLKFLQIDVDETTREVSSSVNGPAKGRKNYKLFEGTRIITDDNNKDLVEDHLGKHPVIHLDFKGTSIDSVEAAKMRCRTAVHRAFQNHSYLTTSTKLVPGDEKGNAERQNVCNEWCSDIRYKKPDLNDSLVNLTEFLYNHFNRAKVYILVDEFDAIFASAMRIIRKKSLDDKVAKLENICGILGSLLGPVTNGCDHVAGAIFTGVSYAPGVGCSSHFNNFTTMRFLDGTKIIATDQDFVPFYGATREEVESLIQKFVENKELVMFERKEEFLNDTNQLDAKKIMDDVQSRYNSYFDRKGNHIFCLQSVLQYLDSGEARNYWMQTNGIEDFHMIVKCEPVVYDIMKLMGWQMIKFQRRDKITIRNLVDLHDILAVENVDEVSSEVFFNLLMDQGFLTYPEGGEKAQDGKFELPNAEIRAALSVIISLRKIYDTVYEAYRRKVRRITTNTFSENREKLFKS